MLNLNLNQEISKIFPVLEVILPKEVLSEFANAMTDEIHLFHFCLGMFMRNNLLLPDSKLYDEFISAGIHHKDDMSAMIIRLFHEYLSQINWKSLARNLLKILLKNVQDFIAKFLNTR